MRVMELRVEGAAESESAVVSWMRFRGWIKVQELMRLRGRLLLSGFQQHQRRVL